MVANQGNTYGNMLILMREFQKLLKRTISVEVYSIFQTSIVIYPFGCINIFGGFFNCKISSRGFYIMSYCLYDVHRYFSAIVIVRLPRSFGKGFCNDDMDSAIFLK